MLTKELLKNVMLFLERDAKANGAREAYALAEVHSAVADELKRLETPPSGENK